MKKFVKLGFAVMLATTFAFMGCKHEVVNSEERQESFKYEFHETVTLLPAGTDGTAGPSGTYVLFGDWPQTIKANNVTVDESTIVTAGANTYYLGSDGYYYAKCIENAYRNNYTYSDGTSVELESKNSVKYFKVEPIKWRVLTDNYPRLGQNVPARAVKSRDVVKQNGNILLLAENVLTANIPYYQDVSVREPDLSQIRGKSVMTIFEQLEILEMGLGYPMYPNRYKFSTIRAYLNGKYENIDPQPTTFEGKGFLQTAFTEKAQELILTTVVDNSASSTTDSGNNIEQAKSEYLSPNTADKIFLLSEREVTSNDYGFPPYNSSGVGNSRIRIPTDYAKANCAEQSMTEGYGCMWWLRSPDNIYTYHDTGWYARAVNSNGTARGQRDKLDEYYWYDGGRVDYKPYYGVCPALCISSF